MAGEFAITTRAIEPETLKAGLLAGNAGACASFEGWVRNINEGEAVDALEYETHEAIAISEGRAVLAEALARFDLIEAVCVHRVGRLEIGDCAVWVGVSAGHRGPAFDACRYIIDEIKHRLPIWKKEHYREGEAAWVNCATRAAASAPDTG